MGEAERWTLEEGGNAGDASGGYLILRRGADWVTTFWLPGPVNASLDAAAAREKTSFARQLVADANRGIESAEVAAMVDRACDSAEKELRGRSPAWVAANLVREAVLVLTMDRPKEMADCRLGASIATLGSGMEILQKMVITEEGDYQLAGLATADAEPEGSIG